MIELTPETKLEKDLEAILNETAVKNPVTRIEQMLADIAAGNLCALTPVTRIEKYLANISGVEVEIPTPVTRIEYFLAAIAGMEVTLPKPITRIEYLLNDWVEMNEELVTLTGEIITFLAKAAKPFREFEVTLEPIQDLHGQDAPYPAGGGKNLFDGSQVVAWSNHNGMTITKNDDGSFVLNGTATATDYQAIYVTLPAGTYTLSGCPSGGSQSGYSIYLGSPINKYDLGSGVDFTLAEETQISVIIPRVINGTQCTNLLFKPMICLASAPNPTTFAPYSNICPIEGWTGAEAYDDPSYVGLVEWNQQVTTDTGFERTKSGAIVTVDDALAEPAEKLEVAFEPIQDLHGQNAPYPAGGGANILPLTVDALKSANSGSSWSGNVCTINGVTFTINQDASGNVVGITVNGTASANTFFYACKSFATSGTLYMSGCPSGGSDATHCMYAAESGSVKGFDTGNGSTFSITSEINVIIRVMSGANPNNALYKPLLSTEDIRYPNFVPYSNICPITGWTGCEVNVTGNNLVSQTPYLGLDYNKNVGTVVNLTDGGEVTVSDNTISFNVGVWGYKDFITPHLHEGTYYFRFGIESSVAGSFRGTLYIVENNGVNDVVKFKSTFNSTNGVKQTAVVISENDYIVFDIGSNVSATITLTDFQVEIGSTSTPWEAPNITTLSATFPDTVYGGTHEFVSGALTAKKAKDSALLSAYSTKYIGDTFDLYVFNNFANNALKDNSNQICNIAKYQNTDSQTLHFYLSENKKLQIYLPKDIDLTQTVEVCYELATPTEISLTPQPISTLNGVNNVWSNTNAPTTLQYIATINEIEAITGHKFYTKIGGTSEVITGAGETLYAEMGQDIVCDLTEMFGAGNEPTKAEFEELFPNEYYPYNAGEQLNVGAVNGEPYRHVQVTFGALKNLFDIDNFWDNGSTMGTGEVDKYIVMEVPNGNYTISTNVINNTNSSIASVLVSDGLPQNMSPPSSSAGGVFLNNPRTINITTGQLVVYVRVESSGGYLTWDETTFAPYYIQVEAGSSATSYEPYGTMCGGMVDLVSGVLTVTYFLYTVTKDTSLSTGSGYNKTNTTNRYTVVSNAVNTGYTIDIKAKSDILKYVFGNAIWLNDNQSVFNTFTLNSKQLHMNFENATVGIESSDDGTTRTAKIKAWLENNPITFAIPLAEPITYQLTPQQINYLRGRNNIWSDGNNSVTLQKSYIIEED